MDADSIENAVIANQSADWCGNPYPWHPSGCLHPKGANDFLCLLNGSEALSVSLLTKKFPEDFVLRE